MTCRRRIRRKRRRKPIVISALFLLIVGIWLYMALAVRPVIRTLSQEQIRSITVETVNTSVARVMENNPAYIDLTEIVKDADGNIAVIRSNAAAANSLARSVTIAAQQDLSTIADCGIPIPIGSLSGISFLAGRGPDVHIKAIPVGTIDASFSSQFIPAGINQTLHKLFLSVTASVNIVIPGAENKVTTVTQVLIGESIIIGKVPSVYFGSQSAQNTHNFVP